MRLSASLSQNLSHLGNFKAYLAPSGGTKCQRGMQTSAQRAQEVRHLESPGTSLGFVRCNESAGLSVCRRPDRPICSWGRREGIVGDMRSV